MSTCQIDLEQDDASRQDVLAFLEDLWQKLDGQIRSTEFDPENRLYLRLMIEEKIRIEQELSGALQSIATDQPQVTAEQLEHFQAVSRV